MAQIIHKQLVKIDRSSVRALPASTRKWGMRQSWA